MNKKRDFSIDDQLDFKKLIMNKVGKLYTYCMVK